MTTIDIERKCIISERSGGGPNDCLFWQEADAVFAVMALERSPRDHYLLYPPNGYQASRWETNGHAIAVASGSGSDSTIAGRGVIGMSIRHGAAQEVVRAVNAYCDELDSIEATGKLKERVRNQSGKSAIPDRMLRLEPRSPAPACQDCKRLHSPRQLYIPLQEGAWRPYCDPCWTKRVAAQASESRQFSPFLGARMPLAEAMEKANDLLRAGLARLVDLRERGRERELEWEQDRARAHSEFYRHFGGSN